MVKAEDLDDYYRIPSDKRSLNYDQYFDLEVKLFLNQMNITHIIQRLDTRAFDLLRTIPEIKRN